MSPIRLTKTRHRLFVLLIMAARGKAYTTGVESHPIKNNGCASDVVWWSVASYFVHRQGKQRLVLQLSVKDT